MASPINFSIKASLPSSVAAASVRSLSTIPSSSSSSTATSSNHRYNHQSSYSYQIRHFARPSRISRPSSISKRRTRGPTNNNNNNNGIITNNPPPNNKHATKNILIIGSQGELGKTLVSHFGNQMNWNVVGADILDPSNDVVQTSLQKKGLKEYIALPHDGSVADLSVALYRGVSNYLTNHESSSSSSKRNQNLDAIICASGGWMGDVDKFTYQHSMMDNELLEDVDPEEEYIRESSEVCERMMKVNYYPVVAGGMIGQRFLNGGTDTTNGSGDGGGGTHTNNGLFVIIGASAALSPTPGMLGYGASKAASHHYLQSYGPLVTDENGSTSVGILPLMLDTPANRAMLGVDDDDNDDDRYSKMVKPIHIANEIGEWIKNPHLRPHSGSLVKVIAKNRMDGSGGAAFHLVR